jgi:peptidoglycan/xylan/chitin deacetylase (PgdA/CDA1 family)
MTVLLHDWHEPALQEAFAQSSGLCVSHMARLLAHGRAHAHLPAILVAQREHLHKLHDELCEFIRKQDYRFAREPYGSEADAWRRAVELFVGTTWSS